MLRFLKRMDVVLLMAISFTSIVIVVVDFFNFFDNVEFFQKVDYSLLTIAILALIGIHLVLHYINQSEFQERFPHDIDKIIRSLHGVNIEIFPSTVELEKYLAKRVKEAKIEVCDLSWKGNISRGYSLKPRVRSHKSYETSIGLACDKIMYREIFVFSDERRKEKLERRLKDNKSGYSCRYFEGDFSIPRLQFVLIDKEEIIFASSFYPKLCAITHAELSEIFQSYYDEIWNAATPIKDGDVIYQKEIDKIFKS